MVSFTLSFELRVLVLAFLFTPGRGYRSKTFYLKLNMFIFITVLLMCLLMLCFLLEFILINVFSTKYVAVIFLIFLIQDRKENNILLVLSYT